MAKEDIRFDTEMRRAVRNWCSPPGSWDMSVALAKPVYAYISAIINKQKERAFPCEIAKGEFAIVVEPYDEDTYEDMMTTKPVCLSDIIVEHIRTHGNPDEIFDALSASMARARKKLKKKGAE